MQQVILIDDKNVEFEVVDDQITTTSKDVAKIFDKQHQHIIAKIQELPQDDFSQSNFRPTSYIDSFNREQKMYHLTRDGFSLLAMGFTGKKAYKWKIQFIDAFNKMELYIRNNHIPPRPDTHLLSPMELMELQFKAHKELDHKVQVTNERLDALEQTSVFTSADCRKYLDAVGRRVEELMSTHNLPYCDRKSLFSSIHLGIKKLYQVPTYKDLPHYLIDDVIANINTCSIRAKAGY